MPAGYAHYIYGQKVLKVLDEPYRTIIENHIDLFNIGVHGPDLLFYFDAYKSNEISRRGNEIHRQAAYIFFNHASKVVDSHKDEQAYKAYLYGFICHYMLDHACHPTVGELERTLNMTHSEIESELDRKILVNENKDPLTTCLTSHIHLNQENANVIAPFFDLDEKTIYKSIKDLLFYLEWIRCPGKLKRAFVHLVMKIGGIYEGYKGLIINYQENKKSINDINHLIELLEEALIDAKEAIETFELGIDERYHYNFETNDYIK